ncbi:MAG: T9SS type A sorting domain-containing protein [Cyclobacteriaceae bacterium]
MKKQLVILILLLSFSHCLVTAQGIVIQGGAHINITGGAHLVITDATFENEGTFSAGTSTVSMRGSITSANAQITGSTATTFYNLEVNKSAEAIELGNNINVDNTLSLTSGSVNLKGNTIQLNSNGMLTGVTESNRIFCGSGGTILKSQDLNAPSAVDVGGFGFAITSGDNLGSTTVTMGFESQGGGQSINRFYDIQPTNNSGLDVTVVFSYLDSELNSNSESGLDLWKNDGSGWVEQSATLDAVNNTLTKSGITGFSIFTATSSATLPVELLFFEGERTGFSEILLSWATANELNNEGFEIEESFDGVNFNKVGFVEGAGTTSTAQDYSFIRRQQQAAYYRLRQVDFDGRFEYSPTIYTPNQLDEVQIEVYPNPTTDFLFIRGGSDVSVYDTSGALKRARQTSSILDSIDLRELAEGVYLVKISTPDGNLISKRVIKQ